MLRVAVAAVLLQLNAERLSAQDNPAQALPAIGRTGGTFFSRPCAAGQVLTGIRARVGLVIDALGIKCRPVNANGTLGAETSVGDMAGGSGGTFSSGSCPAGDVVTGQAGDLGVPLGLSLFDLRCRKWDAATRSFIGPATAILHVVTGPGAPLVVISKIIGTSDRLAECSRQTQPVVSLRGRAGTIIDAAALTCDEP